MPRSKLLASVNSPSKAAPPAATPVVERKGVDLIALGFMQLPAEVKGMLLPSMWRIFRNIFRSRNFVEMDFAFMYKCIGSLNASMFATGRMLAALTVGNPSRANFLVNIFTLWQKRSRRILCSTT